MMYAFVLPAFAGAAVAHQPGVAVTNSPPPIVAVPVERPSSFQIVVPPVERSSAPRPPAPRIVRPPQWRRPAQAYVTSDDYPASALAQRAEGWVAFTLEVGADGRVHGCTVTGSSGSPALDNATCMIMRRRARFTPAMNSFGNPEPWAASGEVEWRVPPMMTVKRSP